MNIKTPKLQQINLLTGWPSPPLLPPQSLLDASTTVLTDPTLSSPSLGYGPDEGYEPLRQELASWLTKFYTPKDAIAPERICITGGASQNLACLLQTFTDPIYTRHVFMIAPTYFLACRIFEDSGFAGRMKAIPEDVEGIDIDLLSRKLQESEEEAMTSGNLEPVCNL
jgi:DNA-binding transcriptional MocR family regulator